MIQYEKNAYASMFGRISGNATEIVAACISQCTGCTCNCRCSCSGGLTTDVEWEIM